MLVAVSGTWVPVEGRRVSYRAGSLKLELSYARRCGWNVGVEGRGGDSVGALSIVTHNNLISSSDLGG